MPTQHRGCQSQLALRAFRVQRHKGRTLSCLKMCHKECLYSKTNQDSLFSHLQQVHHPGSRLSEHLLTLSSHTSSLLAILLNSSQASSPPVILPSSPTTRLSTARHRPPPTPIRSSHNNQTTADMFPSQGTYRAPLQV